MFQTFTNYCEFCLISIGLSAIFDVMFKSLTSFLLCAVLAFPWSMKIAITADFLIHQDYIAQNLCENRDKPELACNGQCVFMKKLQGVEERAPIQSPLPDLNRLEVSSFLIKQLEWPSFTQAPIRLSLVDLNIEEETITGFLRGVFRPPTFR